VHADGAEHDTPDSSASLCPGGVGSDWSFHCRALAVAAVLKNRQAKIAPLRPGPMVSAVYLRQCYDSAWNAPQM